MVLISLNIDEKIKQKMKLLGVTHAGVYARGVRVLLENPEAQYEKALAEWEKKTSRMSNLLDHYIRRSIELEDRIKELEEVNKCFSKKKK